MWEFAEKRDEYGQRDVVWAGNLVTDQDITEKVIRGMRTSRMHRKCGCRVRDKAGEIRSFPLIFLAFSTALNTNIS